MRRCCLHNNLSVIQGDTLEITLALDNPEELVIQDVTFVCKSLDIDSHFTATSVDDLWMLILGASVTENFRVGNFLFDVNAVSEDGEVFTVVYQGNLEVLYKYNKTENGTVED